MTRIHDKELNNIAGCNLLHIIINPPKQKIDFHYSTILYGCMNTKKGRVNFKIFKILLNIGYSSTIVIGNLV